MYGSSSTYTQGPYGGSGGSSATFSIAAGDYVKSIYICIGSFVNLLKFTTYNGVVSPVYGTSTSSCYTINLAKPALLGFGGYYGDYLDGIQFISH